MIGANQLTNRGVLEIAEHEGIVLGYYLDSANVPTCWIGHTKAAGTPDPAAMHREDTRGWTELRVTEELLKAVRLFDSDLGRYERRVVEAIKTPLKKYQFDAVTSWDFNTGGVTWRSKSGRPCQLVREINSGDMSGNGFMGWLKPKELLKRRKAELALFRTGNYDANGDQIPIYDSLGDGRTRYRGAISGARLLDLMNKAGTDHKPAAPKGPMPDAVSLTLLGGTGLVGFSTVIDAQWFWVIGLLALIGLWLIWRRK